MGHGNADPTGDVHRLRAEAEDAMNDLLRTLGERMQQGVPVSQPMADLLVGVALGTQLDRIAAASERIARSLEGVIAIRDADKA